MKRIFKLVRVTDGRKVSAILSLNSGYLVEYKVGEEAKATLGKLFGFETVGDARVFAQDWVGRKLEIWEAEAEGVESPRWISGGLGVLALRRFWERFPGGSIGSTSPIPGSLLCDSVKLTKLVETVG